MTIVSEKRPSESEGILLAAAADLLAGSATYEQGTIEVAGETVTYDLFAVDARSAAQRERDKDRGRLAGNLIVVVPGHGQTARGPQKLVAGAALMSRARVAWCLDPVPARGGDQTQAQAMAGIVRQRLATLFPGGEPGRATLVGWSHGGGESLRTCQADPELFPQCLALCPTGMIPRRPLTFVARFFLEAIHAQWSDLRRRDWAALKDTLRVGLDFGRGLVRDLWRSRSFRALIEDLRGATQKVPGREYDYPGEVAVLFAARDRVIRWRDVFPGCQTPEDLAAILPGFQQANFPRVKRLQVQIVDGDHVSPEKHAPAFLRPGLELLDQLDETPCPPPADHQALHPAAPVQPGGAPAPDSDAG
jgi:hypothetical protein